MGGVENSTMSVADFVSAVAATTPQARSVVDEHLTDNGGELLLHLLMSDLLRLAEDQYGRGDFQPLDELLGIVDAALRTGEERLENAVAVSFVEMAGAWEASAQPFIRTWPKGLRDEAARQAP